LSDIVWLMIVYDSGISLLGHTMMDMRFGDIVMLRAHNYYMMNSPLKVVGVSDTKYHKGPYIMSGQYVYMYSPRHRVLQ